MVRMGIRLVTALCCLGAVLLIISSVASSAERWLADREVAARLEQKMASLPEEIQEKHLKIAQWYNWSLVQGQYVPDWDYRNILDLGEGSMGLLQIPELEIRLPITHGIGGVVGHDPGSMLPIGGQQSQTVLYINRAAGWREEMTVETILPGTKLTWQVVSIQTMPWPWPVEHPADGSLLTLVWDRQGTRTLIRCRLRTGQEIGEEPMLKKAILVGMLPLIGVPVPCMLGKGLKLLHDRRQNQRKNRKFL